MEHEVLKNRLQNVIIILALVLTPLIALKIVVRMSYNNQNELFQSIAQDQKFMLDQVNWKNTTSEDSYYIGTTQASIPHTNNICAQYAIKYFNDKAYWFGIITDCVDFKATHLTNLLGIFTGSELSKDQVEDLATNGIDSQTAKDIVSLSKEHSCSPTGAGIPPDQCHIIDDHMYGAWMQSKFAKYAAQNIYNKM